MITLPFFSCIEDFRECAPGVDSSLTFAEINSSFLNAKKMIINIIGSDLWDILKTLSEKENQTNDEKEAVDAIRIALSNLTMYKYKVFEIVKKRTSDKADVYKNELDTMKREYIDNYYNSIDSLICIFEKTIEGDPFIKWKETDAYKNRELLLIKTLPEFQQAYGIDHSYYFFHMSAYLQVKILDDKVMPIINSTDVYADNDKLKRRVMRVVAALTVAEALLSFDPIELPSNIRNNLSGSTTSRNVANEQDIMKQLSDRISKGAMDDLSAIDMILHPANVDNYETVADVNHEEDSFYLMP